MRGGSQDLSQHLHLSQELRISQLSLERNIGRIVNLCLNGATCDMNIHIYMKYPLKKLHEEGVHLCTSIDNIYVFKDELLGW